MVERTNKPGRLLPATSGDSAAGSVHIGHDHVKLSLTSGESAEILLYGATVISWKNAQGEEKLWLSEAAKVDGSKAVRGGIPLVFPVFGPPPKDHATSALPQHGFARTAKWELLGKNESSSSAVTVDFGLGPENLSVDMRKAWPFDFGLIYSVTLAAGSLETKILVRNEGGESWNFQTLFHTYLRVDDVAETQVEGLQGVEYVDKVAKETKKEERELVTIAGEVDRVYKNAKETVKVKSGDKVLFKVERTGLDDVVVWNPWENAAKNMGDFRPETGHKNMLCIEAGSVSDWNTLEPQSVWEGGVTLHA